MTQTHVFITGGTSGLGLELARHYMNKGARVGTCSFETIEQLPENFPDNLKYYQADVTDQEAVARAIGDFSQAGLDLVIANAGISMPKASIPDFQRGRKLIEINVLGVLNTFEPALKVMVPQKSGQLVALGSIAGLNGLPGTAIYGASKAAVIQMCESFEIDLSEYNISVTTVAPGFIKTPLTEANQHKMPFLMTPEFAIQKIVYAIEKKKGLYIFPLPLMIMARLLSLMPRSWYKRFMKADYLHLRG